MALNGPSYPSQRCKIPLKSVFGLLHLSIQPASERPVRSVRFPCRTQPRSVAYGFTASSELQELSYHSMRSDIALVFRKDLLTINDNTCSQINDVTTWVMSSFN